jgi:hypothetical protein
MHATTPRRCASACARSCQLAGLSERTQEAYRPVTPLISTKGNRRGLSPSTGYHTAEDTHPFPTHLVRIFILIDIRHPALQVFILGECKQALPQACDCGSAFACVESCFRHRFDDPADPRKVFIIIHGVPISEGVLLIDDRSSRRFGKLDNALGSLHHAVTMAVVGGLAVHAVLTSARCAPGQFHAWARPAAPTAMHAQRPNGQGSGVRGRRASLTMLPVGLQRLVSQLIRSAGRRT